ncbi:MAG: hypothetical protein JO356_15970 [Acidobacteria bacterium]|nr:hypothetical protein [Acidobacteriota bacterium]
MSQSLLFRRAMVVAALLLAASSSLQPQNGIGASSFDQLESLRAFSRIASVLTSPRCLNCHVPGDSPLQGDAGTPHGMNVKRGPDGRGTPAMRCSNCHQDTNSSQLHAPPGCPDWRLPPPSMRMAWQGLSVGELCRTLKDPAANGNRSLEQLLEHFRNDRIVNWGWAPGPGRTIPPLSHDDFVAEVTRWVKMGSACPPE